MKLAYYLQDGKRQWGSVAAAAGTIRRIGGVSEEWAPEVMAKGARVLDLEGSPISLSEITLLPPIARGAEFLGTGLNSAAWSIPTEGADTGSGAECTTPQPGLGKQ